MFLFLFGCVSPSPHAFSSSKGINTVSTKLAADLYRRLYGHDLDDLRILSHCKLMPGACKSILTPELPAGTHANLDT